MATCVTHLHQNSATFDYNIVTVRAINHFKVYCHFQTCRRTSDYYVCLTKRYNPVYDLFILGTSVLDKYCSTKHGYGKKYGTYVFLNRFTIIYV